MVEVLRYSPARLLLRRRAVLTELRVGLQSRATLTAEDRRLH